MSEHQRPWRRQAGQRIPFATGAVLQPLSTEFLYRSPHDACVHACRWYRFPRPGSDHAAS